MESLQCRFISEQSNRTGIIDVQAEFATTGDKLSRLGKANWIVSRHQRCVNLGIGKELLLVLRTRKEIHATGVNGTPLFIAGSPHTILYQSYRAVAFE